MIVAEHLTRRFGTALAVDDVSLRVPDGTLLALLGPNGAGKTTTVRMLAGLLRPSAGHASVAGYDVVQNPMAVRACVGLVTDQPGLHETMTVPAYLDFFGSIYGLAPAARAQRIDDLLTFFDLAAHRRERMSGFSKGMKQKVALARALLHEPSVLFLDEPTSGLDPLGARAVRDLILDLKRANRSIVLCTHDLDEAERLADRVAIVRRGRIVACDTPAALRRAGSPETKVRVVLAAPCPAVIEALVGIAGVEQATLVTIDPPDTRDALAVEYATLRPIECNPVVLDTLIGLGARVVSVTCTTRTLEDVYADTIGGEHPA